MAKISTENFGLTVGESLSVGTPVISSEFTPWEGLNLHRCGWWIKHGVATLVDTLDKAISLDSDERIAMGQRGRDWIERDFSWEAIGKKSLHLYEWLLGQSSKPDFVDS